MDLEKKCLRTFFQLFRMLQNGSSNSKSSVPPKIHTNRLSFRGRRDKTLFVVINVPIWIKGALTDRSWLSKWFKTWKFDLTTAQIRADFIGLYENSRFRSVQGSRVVCIFCSRSVGQEPLIHIPCPTKVNREIEGCLYSACSNPTIVESLALLGRGVDPLI